MENIRILHLYKKSILDSYGGVEKFIDTLCKCTYELDIDNVLFSLSTKNLNKKITLDKYTVINAKEDIYILVLSLVLILLVYFNNFNGLNIFIGIISSLANSGISLIKN